MNKSLRQAKTIMPLLRFSWPIMGELLLAFFAGLIMFSSLGKFSGAAAGGIGVVLSVLAFFQMFAGAISQAGGVLIARYLGAKEDEKAGKVAQNLLVILSLLSVCILGLAFWGDEFLLVNVMNLSGDAAAHGLDFFRIARWSLVLHCFLQLFVALFRGHGNNLIPMKTAFIAHGTNIVSLILLRSGFNNLPLSVPQFIAFGLMTGNILALTFLLFQKSYSREIRLQIGVVAQPDFAVTRELLWLTILLLCEPFAYNLAQLGTSRILSCFGETALAARAFVGIVSGIPPLAAIALGWGAQVRVGFLLGEKNHDEAGETVLRGCRFSLIFCPLCSLIICLFSPFIMTLFTSDVKILVIAQALLGVQVLLELGRSCNCVVTPSLKAVGEGVFVTKLAFLSMLVISLPLAWLLAFNLQLGILGTALVAAFDELFRGVFNVNRWKKRFLKATAANVQLLRPISNAR